jgi:hypothetical protein
VREPTFIGHMPFIDQQRAGAPDLRRIGIEARSIATTCGNFTISRAREYQKQFRVFLSKVRACCAPAQQRGGNSTMTNLHF